MQDARLLAAKLKASVKLLDSNPSLDEVGKSYLTLLAMD